MNWNNFKLFYHVAKAGNITAAARESQVSQPALSRSIANLESRLNTKLLERHTRGITLTHQGKVLFEEVEKIFARFELIRQIFKNDESQIEGELRVFLDSGLLDTWFTYYIDQFIAEYPNLYLSLISNDSKLDIIKNKVDIALCTDCIDSPLITKQQILTWRRRLYASPDYLKNMGEPRTIKDLDHHHLIAFGEEETFPSENMDWHLKIGREDGDPRIPFLKINSLRSMLMSAEKGHGIVSFSKESLLLKNSNLVQILPDVQGPQVNIYMVYLKQMRNIGKVKAFCDYIEKVVKEFAAEHKE
ncbi:MAG: LysR family transcriptional regulator [Alphaproteobacteria bacterium]|nr:LysR family transcriptional regulator [Alphaproteobacteria bacterium]